MIGIFTARGRRTGQADGPGPATLAVRAAHGERVPAGCVGVICDRSGATRRIRAGERMALGELDIGYCFHPGPYACELLPFAAAPEVGLRVHFAVDSPDPRTSEQRFDLYLFSEAGARLDLAPFCASMQAALQRELAQGHLDLPPCTTLDEWNLFRAGFNQLMYTRFGVTVDDCVPADLGDTRDYARMLRERAAAAEAQAPVAARAPQPLALCKAADAAALRRLFLELPRLMCALRLAVLPQGQQLFHAQQSLLRRLDLASLAVNTMPALELAAPGQALADAEQRRRACHSGQAVAALDEAWALLARLGMAADAQLPVLFDEADRIVANLEQASAARRQAHGGMP